MDTTSLGLLSRARTSEECAWEILVKRYQPLIYSRCLHQGLSSHDANDVVQVVFFAIFSKLPSFDREGKYCFRAWLKKITANTIIDFLRRRARHGLELDSDLVNRLVDHVSQGWENEPENMSKPVESDTRPSSRREDLRCTLERIRANYSPLTWMAFEQVVLHGRSAKDVAADLGLTYGAVRQAKYKILKRIRHEYGDEIDSL